MLTIAIALLDVLLRVDAALAPLLIAGPLLAARRAPPRPTAYVAALALAAAIADGIAQGVTAGTTHSIGVITALAGGALAVSFARVRRREGRLAGAAERGRLHASLLAHVSDLFAGSGDLHEQLAELARLTVPDMAQICIVDLVDPHGRITEAAVRAVDERDAEALAALRARHPVELDSVHPVARAIQTGRPQLIAEPHDHELASFATSAEHLEFILAARHRSVVVVPLTARGRRVGALTLLSEERAYDDDDVALLVEFARRSGVAIDHARLFGELAATEAELQTVLEVMDDAVVVLDDERRVVYANRSAVHLFGGEDVDSLAAPGPVDLRLRWDLRDERGDPIDIATVPWRRALTGERPEPAILRATERATGEVRFWQSRATPIASDPGRARLAVSVLEDVTETKKRELEQRFLAQATKLLTSSLSPQLTLEKIAWAAVPELADWCAVDVPDENGRIRRLATADVDLDRLRQPAFATAQMGTSGDLPVGAPEVLRTGEPALYADITDDMLRLVSDDDEQLTLLRSISPRSALCVPILAGDSVLGVITAGTTHDSGRRLTVDDCAVMSELGRRAGMALENARAHSESSSIAATLQHALLPPRLPLIPGLAIAARFRAAGEAAQVGGDFYDLFEVDGGWMVLMGDVSGKGAEAAAITALARYTMRTAARYEHSPSCVLQRLNEALTADRERQALCSAVCARVEPAEEGARLIVACAGHPLPLVTGEGEGIWAAGEPGSLLGAFQRGEWHDQGVVLTPGESLVLFTDGVTDTLGSGDRFGHERLEELVCGAAGRPADEIAGRIDDALKAFQVGEQRDDVALLVLQAVGGGVSAPERRFVRGTTA